MAYRPYKDLSTERIKGNIKRLKYELKNLRPSASGQASNYYAPAIHYHEEELKLREPMECPNCDQISLVIQPDNSYTCTEPGCNIEVTF